MQHNGQIVGYARVSTQQQNLARQLQALGEVDRLFQDKVSGGSRAARVGLEECLRYVREGDTVRVVSMDRLARSLADLQKIVAEIVDKGASVHFVKENQTYSLSSNDSMSRLLLQILGAFAEFERNLIKERQAEGIALAKKAGKYKGRARALSPAQLTQAEEQIRLGIPKARVARELGVDRSTLYRALASLESQRQ